MLQLQKKGAWNETYTAADDQVIICQEHFPKLIPKIHRLQ